MVTILDGDDVARLLDVENALPAVESALIEQFRDAVERPDRPHFPVGAGIESADPLGTGLTMPAYIHGYPWYVTKLASVHEDNPDDGLPTVRAQILLTDAANGEPAALMNGTHVTSVRTGCIGGLAARELATDPVRLAVIGAGTQARWQTRAIAATRTLSEVRVYSPSDSKHRCVADLRADGIPATAADSARAAIEGATVVVTATTSTSPVFQASALDDAELVVAVGAYTPETRELETAAVTGASARYADVPEEAAETGDFRETPYEAADLVPLGAMLSGAESPPREDGYALVKSVGSAVLDLAAARIVYERARSEDVGTEVSLGP